MIVIFQLFHTSSILVDLFKTFEYLYCLKPHSQSFGLNCLLKLILQAVKI